jgi:hypothetical protein
VIAGILTVLVMPIITGEVIQDSSAPTLYALLVGLIGATVVLRLGLLAWTVHQPIEKISIEPEDKDEQPA